MSKTFLSFRLKHVIRSCAFVLAVLFVMNGETSRAIGVAPHFVRHSVDTSLCSSGSFDLSPLLRFTDGSTPAVRDTFYIQSRPSATGYTYGDTGTLSGFGTPPSVLSSDTLANNTVLYLYNNPSVGRRSFTIRISNGYGHDDITFNIRLVTPPSPTITGSYNQVNVGNTITFTGGINTGITADTGFTGPVTSMWTISPSAYATVSGGLVTGLNVGSGTTVSYTLRNACGPVTASSPAINVVTNIPPTLNVPTLSAALIPGTPFTLSGTGFYGGSSNYTVYFGADSAVVNSVTSGSINVIVPVGATYAPIYVLDRTSKLSSFVMPSFTPIFDSTSFIGSTFTNVYSSAPTSLNVPNAPSLNGGPYSIEYGDMNGDGRIDMVVSGTGNNKAFVYLNTATLGQINTSSFAAPLGFDVAAAPISMRLADLDGDGKLDIITADAGAAQVSVLRNTTTSGSLNFATRFDIAVPGILPDEVSIGDFNNDGRPDIAVIVLGVRDSGEAHGYIPSNSEKHGKLVVIKNNYEYSAAIAMSRGSFDTTTIWTFDTTSAPISVAAGDLNGDGKADLVVSDHHQRQVCVFKNTSNTSGLSFASPINLSTAVGNGVLASGGSLLNPRPYNLSSYRSGYPEQLKIGDLDNDGRADLAVAVTDSDLLTTNQYDKIVLFHNTSSGSSIIFSSQDTTLNTHGAAPGALTLADLSGDGQLDIINSNAGSGSLSIFKNTGSGFSSPVNLPVNSSAGTVCVAVGDIDGNTIPDIAVVGRQTSKVYIFRVYPRPDTSSIIGDTVICLSSPTTLHSHHGPTATGYWTVRTGSNITLSAPTNDTVVTITGTSAGTDTVYYHVIQLADTNVVKKVVRVTATSTPTSTPISGPDTVCVGANITLSALGGGTWTSGSTSVATVTSGGVVHGVSAGTSIITYNVTNSCGTANSLDTITVSGLVSATPISGATRVCNGSTITLSTTAPVGAAFAWRSSSPAIATVSNTGVVGGNATAVVGGATNGADTIFYVVTNMCSSDSSYILDTVSTTITHGTITGNHELCFPGNETLVETGLPAGGVWSSSNPAAVGVSTTGVVTSVSASAGVADISYTYTGCNTISDTFRINVEAPLTAGTISGPGSVCISSTISLSAAAPTSTGATLAWRSTSPSIATVSSATTTGANSVVTVGGVAAGSDTVFYTVTNVCRSDSSFKLITVTGNAVSGTITGNPLLCATLSETLTDASATSGGTWSSSNSAIVSVNSSTGVATAGATAGSATITYSVTTCGAPIADVFTITVQTPLAHPAITGATRVCIGSDITLSATPASGIWHSTAPTVSSVNSAGVVHGVSAGQDTIFYAVSNVCGSDSSFILDTVSAAPVSGTITGNSLLCATLSETLTDAGATTGGTWSSSNSSVVSVNSSTGVATAGAAAGSATITYSVATCGTPVADVFTITVQTPLAHPTITGATRVCIGSDITLSATPASGIWRSTSPTTVSSVNSAGVVHGIAAGQDTIFYAVSNVCGSDSSFILDTVSAAPVSGTITGISPLCAGSSETLTYSGTAGGTWTSATTSVVTIDPVTGVATGVAGATGSSVITYALTTCTSISNTLTITVNTRATAGTISGATSLCENSTAPLTYSGGAAGTWSSTSGLSITGAPSTSITIHSGATARVDTVFYVVATPGCTSDTAKHFDTTLANVTVAAITGVNTLDTVCIGNTVQFSDVTPGGTWTTGNGAIASVSNTGLVTGNAGGNTTITYAITSGCGAPANATRAIAVKAHANAGGITGPASVCSGLTVNLASSGDVGGVWRSTNATTATANASTGQVTAGFPVTAPGTNPSHSVDIHYVVNNSCSSDSSSFTLYVNTAPRLTPITTVGSSVTPVNAGLDSICIAGTLTETATPNNATVTATPPLTVLWRLSNANATLSGGTGSAAPVITGVIAGLDTLTFKVTNSTCGSDSVKRVIKVKPPTSAGILVAPDNVCYYPGVPDFYLYDTLANGDTISSGTFSVQNGTSLFVYPDGQTTIFADLSMTTVQYVQPGYCGSATSTHNIFVNAGPDAGTITGDTTVCVGVSVTWTDNSTTGDYWYSSNPAIAHVDSLTGVVTGVSGGTATIYYVDTSACGNVSTSQIIHVGPRSITGFIFGQDTSCVGSTVQLSDTVTAAAGGTWSVTSVPAGAASINATGVLTALNAGVATVMYTTTNACGANDTTFKVKVNAAPNFTSATSATTCDSVLFNYSATSDSLGASYTWVRAGVTGIANNADSAIVNTIAEYLDDTTNAVVHVNYVFTSILHGCAGTHTLDVAVSPTPHLTSKLFDTVCSGSLYTYLDVESTGPATIATWIRNPVTGISNPTGNGVHNISETLLNTTLSGATVIYHYTLNYPGCPTHVEDLTVAVNPTPAYPQITTHSPSDVCTRTMFQNFGAASVPPPSVTYTWFATGAQVWATGSDHQYSLVNFSEPGDAVVYLLASIPGLNCPAKDSFPVSVGSSISDQPEVIYFNGDFVCLSSDQDTYQWGYDNRSTLDSSLFEGQTNQNYTVETPDFTGKYYFVITTHNGCMQKSYFNAPTGVKNVTGSMGEMKVYPNPADQFVNVEINNTPGGKYKIEVVNLLGQKLDAKDVVNNKASLDVANLASGVYMINCYRDGVKFTSAKFVKN